MKMKWSYKSGLLCAICAQAALIFLGVSCQKPQEEINWVDLRYKVRDEYRIAADNPEVIKFQVKSTDPWKVYSYHEDEHWCTVTPSSGDDPDKTYDVEVQYNANTGLDDRIDTLVIQSDYWIGKWVKVIQQGTAFLKFAEYEDFIMPRTKSIHEFLIESNQKWTAEIDGDSGWLSIKGPAEGEGNGKITVEAEENAGAMRTAGIRILDRNKQEQAIAWCKQDGVQLEISTSNVKTDYVEKDITINVLSNTRWSIEKENPNDAWMTLGTDSSEGNGQVDIRLSENDTRAIRTGVLIFRTASEGGAFVVEQRLEIKQSYKPFFERKEFNLENFPKGPTGNGNDGWVFAGNAVFENGNLIADASEGGTNRIWKYNNPAGRYRFKILPMESGSRTGFFFKANPVEFRFHLNAATGLTEISNNKKVPNMPGFQEVAFDPSEANIIEFEIIRGTKKKEGKDLCTVNCYLNDVLVNSQKDIAQAMYWKPAVTLYIGALKGKVTYDWMEYSAPIEME